jgi:hypothetical protein
MPDEGAREMAGLRTAAMTLGPIGSRLAIRPLDTSRSRCRISSPSAAVLASIHRVNSGAWVSDRWPGKMMAGVVFPPLAGLRLVRGSWVVEGSGCPSPGC